jgi:hypothetical protein
MAIDKPNKKIEKDNSKKGLIESIVSEEQSQNDENIGTNPNKPKKKIKQKMFYCPPDIEAAILIRKAKTGQDISEIVCEAIKKELKIEIEQAKQLT